MLAINVLRKSSENYNCSIIFVLTRMAKWGLKMMWAKMKKKNNNNNNYITNKK